MSETKTFTIEAVLSISTGRLLGEVRDLYAILNWMTNDNLFTHQLPRASDECQPWLIRWFPELEAANNALPILDSDIAREGPEAGCKLWVGKLAMMGLPLSFNVPRIPRDDHEYKNPYDELVQMRGTDDGVAVVEL